MSPKSYQPDFLIFLAVATFEGNSPTWHSAYFALAIIGTCKECCFQFRQIDIRDSRTRTQFFAPARIVYAKEFTYAKRRMTSAPELSTQTILNAMPAKSHS